MYLRKVAEICTKTRQNSSEICTKKKNTNFLKIWMFFNLIKLNEVIIN